MEYASSAPSDIISMTVKFVSQSVMIVMNGIIMAAVSAVIMDIQLLVVFVFWSPIHSHNKYQQTHYAKPGNQIYVLNVLLGHILIKMGFADKLQIIATLGIELMDCV